MKFSCPVLGQYQKFTSRILEASGKTLSIEHYGQKRASTKCEKKVSFLTQVAYSFRHVAVKFNFCPLPLRQGKFGK